MRGFTQRTIAKLLTPRMFAGFKLHWSMVNKRRNVESMLSTYNTDEVLVPHLLNWDVVHQAGDDCSWSSLFTEVNLLHVVLVPLVAE